MNERKRLCGMQDCPREAVPLISYFEQDLHGRLAQHRVAGREWYRDCDEIRQLVADLNAEHGAPTWQPTWGDGQPRRPRRTVTATRRAMIVDHRR